MRIGPDCSPVRVVLAAIGAAIAFSLGASPSVAQADLAAEPFTQFDIGIASADPNEIVLEWTPLAASGLRLEAEAIEVGRDQSLDDLLRQRGVRPDHASRQLVSLLNPDLGPLDAVGPGQRLVLFRVHGSLPRQNGKPIALTLHLSESQRLEASYALLRQRVMQLEAQYGARTQGLQSRFNELEAAYDPDQLISEPQIRIAANALEISEYRLASVDQQPGFFNDRYQQALRQMRSTTMVVRQVSVIPVSTSDGYANLSVSLAYQGQIAHANPGRCRLAWAVNGLQDIRTAYEDLPPLPQTLRMLPSPILIWVIRDGRTISEPLAAPLSQQQLLAANPSVTLSLREPCSP